VTSVVLLRPVTTTDRYGNDTVTSRERVPVSGAAVAPRSSSDLHAPGRQGVLVGLTVYLPPGSVVGDHDLVEVDGVVHEIEGVAGVWANPLTGTSAGVEVAVRRVSG
jgi:hypothetical protein